ncbi:MAG: zinc metallopeptidase [Polyangiaceae bacterium]|jgi:predicted metalloprotease|nr:zinc metallopeptidase [Polyangiaceae bacterium]
MRLGDVRQSSNVQDRRAGGGGRRVGIAASGVTLVVVIIVAVVTGKNPLTLLSGAGAPGDQASKTGATVDPNDPGAVFTRKILATTEDTWKEALPRLGRPYEEPTLVLFRDGVDSACGFQESAVGPFYCPADKMAYVDLDFLDSLQKKLGAPGDFAAGYVIAHEVGHHVQKLLGTSDRVRADGKDKGASGNAVRLELQADCYAGVWGFHVKQRGLLEVGDIDEALGAATAIGDDTLQRRGSGRVTPETFSHGTSEQRVRWFKRGMDAGDPKACDTFATGSL